jgi:hypothetical protein
MLSFSLRSSAMVALPLATSFSSVCPQVLLSARKSIFLTIFELEVGVFCSKTITFYLLSLNVKFCKKKKNVNKGVYFVA